MDVGVKLINDYRDLVDYSLALLKANAPYFNYYETDESRRGSFTDGKRTIKFRFHGIGCYFEFSDGPVIDIDYAADRYDRIDVWFLKDYWNSGKDKYPGIVSVDDIDVVIRYLLSINFLIGDAENENIVYRKSEYQYPNEFAW